MRLRKRRPRARSTRTISRQADRILEEARARERDYESEGLRSVTISRDDLIRELTHATGHSPFLTQIGWGNAVRGSTFTLNFGIMNPDPWPYSEANLGLCVYWGVGTGIGSAGESLQIADEAIGVFAVELGTLNWSASPYYIDASHFLPTTLAPGASRIEMSYLLYEVNAFDACVVLKRGTLSIGIT
ncbi:MAG: hypothetical protein JWO29_2071 [Arthrobacter sp.]|nr:hypothetical protein [Arthrobacter sp.]